MLVAALLAHGTRDLASVLEMLGETKTSTKATQKAVRLLPDDKRHATLGVASPMMHSPGLSRAPVDELEG